MSTVNVTPCKIQYNGKANMVIDDHDNVGFCSVDRDVLSAPTGTKCTNNESCEDKTIYRGTCKFGDKTTNIPCGFKHDECKGTPVTLKTPVEVPLEYIRVADTNNVKLYGMNPNFDKIKNMADSFGRTLPENPAEVVYGNEMSITMFNDDLDNPNISRVMKALLNTYDKEALNVTSTTSPSSWPPVPTTFSPSGCAFVRVVKQETVTKNAPSRNHHINQSHIPIPIPISSAGAGAVASAGASAGASGSAGASAGASGSASGSASAGVPVANKTNNILILGMIAFAVFLFIVIIVIVMYRSKNRESVYAGGGKLSIKSKVRSLSRRYK